MRCPGGPCSLTLRLDLARLARSGYQGVWRCNRPTAKHLRAFVSSNVGLLAVAFRPGTESKLRSPVSPAQQSLT